MGQIASPNRPLLPGTEGERAAIDLTRALPSSSEFVSRTLPVKCGCDAGGGRIVTAPLKSREEESRRGAELAARLGLLIAPRHYSGGELPHADCKALPYDHRRFRRGLHCKKERTDVDGLGYFLGRDLSELRPVGSLCHRALAGMGAIQETRRICS